MNQESTVNNSSQDEGRKMPALFVGHGTPMNALEDNEFTRCTGYLFHPNSILNPQLYFDPKDQINRSK